MYCADQQSEASSMVDREPAPEGHKHRCTYCGKLLVEEELIYAMPGKSRVPLPFCSEACINAYGENLGDESEESEDIYRAGAT